MICERCKKETPTLTKKFICSDCRIQELEDMVRELTRYADGAYECAFPDTWENCRIADEARALLGEPPLYKLEAK
jgi:hypothetical protein